MVPELAILVAAADVGERADVVLGRHVPGLSRRVARSLALAGHLFVDGSPVRPAHRVALGERLVLQVPTPGAPPPLVVLAVTSRYVYVDKPSGVHTHRLRPTDPLALADAVVAAFPECETASSDAREGGAVHRLDCGTSGVVAFARTAQAYAAARAVFSAGQVHKHYQAVVCPPPEFAWPPREGRWLGVTGEQVEVRAPLGAGAGAEEVVVRREGLPSLTVVRRLSQAGTDRAVVDLDLRTGRRHQARVHLAWLGLPILGDATYGGQPAERLHLHACQLDLGAVASDEVAVMAAPRWDLP